MRTIRKLGRTLLAILILVTAAGAQQYAVVVRVIDGDTIQLSNGERVRLIGVDTPETVHPSKPVQYVGKKASAFTRRLAEGKRVRLDFDWQRKDRYGRMLANVYLRNGTFLKMLTH